MILRYLFTNAFFCRNVLRANILAMPRFQSVVTVSLLNKITFYNHNAVSVCVFFYRTDQVECSSLFFPFLPPLYGDQKSRHFGSDLKSRSTFVFGYTLTRCKLLFFPCLDAFFQVTTGTRNSMLFSRTHELSWKYIYM